MGDDDRGDAALAGVADHRASPPRRSSSRARPTARRRGGGGARRPRRGRSPPAGARRRRADRGSARLGRRARAARARRCPPGCALRRRDAVELEGQRDVLGGGEAGEEVEVLEDVADASAAGAGPCRCATCLDSAVPPMRTSPLVGSSRLPAMVSSVDFPEPRRAHHRDEVALVDREVDLVEGTDGRRRPRRRTSRCRGVRAGSSAPTVLCRMPGIAVWVGHPIYILQYPTRQT